MTTTVRIGGLEISNAPEGPNKWRLTGLSGWYSGAGMRGEFVALPYGDGSIPPERTYRDDRLVTVEGIVTAPTQEAAIRQCWAELAAISPEGYAEDLEVEDEEGTFMSSVYVSGAPQVLPFAPRKARFQLTLRAPDPVKYGPIQTASTSPSSGSIDGLTFPLFAGGFLDFGAYAPSGTVTIANPGTAPYSPIFKIRGAMTTGFRIVSGDDEIVYSAGVALGTIVTLSPYAGGRATIGTSDVTVNLTSISWPEIGPGETKTFTIVPLGTPDANARLDIEFREARR